MHGKALGRTVGMPTANLCVSEGTIPETGVYVTRIKVSDKWFLAVTNIGNRPTYPVDYIISETFIKDFSGDLYGEMVKITPMEFLREEKKFNSFEELKEQIEKDIRR